MRDRWVLQEVVASEDDRSAQSGVEHPGAAGIREKYRSASSAGTLSISRSVYDARRAWLERVLVHIGGIDLHPVL